MAARERRQGENTLPTDERLPVEALYEKFTDGSAMLGAGFEPARLIQPGDFKSPVSTVPPSEQMGQKSTRRGPLRSRQEVAPIGKRRKEGGMGLSRGSI